MTGQRSTVLLVEDDANDEFLTCRVLRTEALLTDITVVRDGNPSGRPHSTGSCRDHELVQRGG